MAIISEFGVSFVSRSLGVNISAKIEEFAVDRNNCHAFLSAKSTSLVLVDEERALSRRCMAITLSQMPEDEGGS